MKRYEVQTRLGAGGMAEVYKARQFGTGNISRPVAIKRIAKQWSADNAFSALFLEEIRLAAKLNHANIVTTLDFDSDEEGLFLVLEYIDGADLRTVLDLVHARGSALPPAVCAFLVGEVLQALDYAHTLDLGDGKIGLIHRDVSPQNILVTRRGEVKLSDFGIARAFASSRRNNDVQGKIGYMSPEQASSGDVDGRSDLFVVGVVLYEMLSGVQPFGDGATVQEVVAQIVRGKHRKLSERAGAVDGDLVDLMEKLLARDPDKRFRSAREALRALQDCRCFPRDGALDLGSIVQGLLDGNGLENLVKVGSLVPAKSRMPRNSIAIALVLGAIAAGSIVFYLHTQSPSRESTIDASPGPRAEQLWREGSDAYRDGDFAAAIAFFRRSYARNSDVELLFDLGQAYRMKGDFVEATRYFRDFIDDTAPGTRNRDLAQRGLDDLAAVVATSVMASKPAGSKSAAAHRVDAGPIFDP